MTKHKVRVEISKTYIVEVEAPSEEAAIKNVFSTSLNMIETKGTPHSATLNKVKLEEAPAQKPGE